MSSQAAKSRRYAEANSSARRIGIQSLKPRPDSGGSSDAVRAVGLEISIGCLARARSLPTAFSGPFVPRGPVVCGKYPAQNLQIGIFLIIFNLLGKRSGGWPLSRDKTASIAPRPPRVLISQGWTRRAGRGCGASGVPITKPSARDTKMYFGHAGAGGGWLNSCGTDFAVVAAM